jgi:hypothetical protein
MHQFQILDTPRHTFVTAPCDHTYITKFYPQPAPAVTRLKPKASVRMD